MRCDRGGRVDMERRERREGREGRQGREEGRKGDEKGKRMGGISPPIRLYRRLYIRLPSCPTL